jgi:hypothetical protein
MWRESSSGTVIAKPDPTRKIDAAVAAVVAYERATQQPEPAVILASPCWRDVAAPS